MKTFIFTNSQGEPIYSANPAIETYTEGELYGVYTCHEAPVDIDIPTTMSTGFWSLAENTWKTRVPKSDNYFSWNSLTEQWVDLRTLADIKSAAITKLNAAWDKATISGFTYLSKQFSTTASSRSDIDGINGYVALYGAFPIGWVGAWKAVDGSYLPIPTVDAWKSFYSAMVSAGLANFTKAQTLKTLIQQPETDTYEKVLAITW